MGPSKESLNFNKKLNDLTSSTEVNDLKSINQLWREYEFLEKKRAAEGGKPEDVREYDKAMIKFLLTDDAWVECERRKKSSSNDIDIEASRGLKGHVKLKSGYYRPAEPLKGEDSTVDEKY